MTCELFQEHGFPTQLTKDPDKPLEDGFFHSLGHGVGPRGARTAGRSGALASELVAGDVLAVEPGLYRKGFGGCRLEDLVLVTDDGGEVLRTSPTSCCLGRLSAEQLLEAVRVVERPDHREVQALLADDVLRDALHVLERDRVDGGEHLVRLAELALEHLAPEAEHDHPLRVLERQDEPALGEVLRLLELVVRHRLGRDAPELLRRRS